MPRMAASRRRSVQSTADLPARAPRACQSRTPGSHRAHARPPDPRRRLRRLCALAVLPVEVPVLRFQQPCARQGHRRGALPCGLPARDRPYGGARARPHRHERVLRRRHAVADGAGDDGRAPRCHRGGVGGRARRRDHARGEPDERRGDALCRLSGRRRQPGLARRAGAERRGSRPARAPAHGRRRRSPPCASRLRISSASRST